MDLVETYKKSFDLVKSHIIESLIYGIVFYILGGLLFLIPIVGAIIYSYFYPRLTEWYYTKVTGDNINPDYKTAFLSLLIPNLLASIGITIILAVLISILMQLGLNFTDILNITNLQQSLLMSLPNFSIFLYDLLGIIIGIIIMIIGGIIWILLLYSIYGSILGKVNKLSIYFEKSLILFAYWLVFYIVTDIILLIIGGIFSLILPGLGDIIVTILNIMIVYPASNLILLLKAKEL
ncbi:putative membrane protein [Candidatus Nanobsidianus stetteri]|uniref:Putative membrane protein n=1 Tax=Nanobsidianus stetteri TaxID=1294122 RepID=R1G3X9_NANST|nr:putative membrane protein [Candidatus Nanobsidianus stetteri]